MSAIIILIGASFIVALGFLIAFISSVRSGQMDDDHTPAIRMLFDPPKESSDRSSIPVQNPDNK